MAFGLYGMSSWYDLEEGTETTNWSGHSVFGLNNSNIMLPPVAVEDTVYVGLATGGGQFIYASFDKGETWMVAKVGRI